MKLIRIGYYMIDYLKDNTQNIPQDDNNHAWGMVRDVLGLSSSVP